MTPTDLPDQQETNVVPIGVTHLGWRSWRDVQPAAWLAFCVVASTLLFLNMTTRNQATVVGANDAVLSRTVSFGFPLIFEARKLPGNFVRDFDAVSLAINCLFGVVFALCTAVVIQRRIARRRQPLQFTLRFLLGTISVIAVVLAVMRLLPGSENLLAFLICLFAFVCTIRVAGRYLYRALAVVLRPLGRPIQYIAEHLFPYPTVKP